MPASNCEQLTPSVVGTGITYGTDPIQVLYKEVTFIESLVT
jgi:hypothetical protein